MSQNRSGRRSRPSSVRLPADTFPTPDEITSRAHALFVEGGRRLTNISEYWLQAEQELLDLGAHRTLGRPTARRRAQRPRRAERSGPG